MPSRPIQRNRPWVIKRDPNQPRSNNASFYNSRAWRKTSKNNLANNPLCAQCERDGITTAAEVTDHITRVDVYRKQGGSLFEQSNHQSLCKPCHAKKSAKEASGWIQRPGGTWVRSQKP